MKPPRTVGGIQLEPQTGLLLRRRGRHSGHQSDDQPEIAAERLRKRWKAIKKPGHRLSDLHANLRESRRPVAVMDIVDVLVRCI
jgi:hypothetical protein